MTRRAFAIVLFCLMPSLVRAQAAAQPTQLVLEFDASVPDADRALIREAIAGELGASLLEDVATGVPVLLIARTPDGHAELSLRENPAPMTRTLPWSADPPTTARDIALMAQNLVLDQTSDLLPAEPAAASAPAQQEAKPEPSAPMRAIDAERPPDFVPKPAPPPSVPPRRNPARLQLLAVLGPALGLPMDVNAKAYSGSSTAHGVIGRFDVPLSSHLSAGGGIGVYQWESGVDPRADDEINLRVTGVMDATASLRVLQPVGSHAELYALAGAGPTFFTNISVVDDSSSDRSARPYVGVNALLTAGSNLRLYRNIGVALELGAQYHFVHGRELAGSRLKIHALHLVAQLGAVWTFDER